MKPQQPTDVERQGANSREMRACFSFPRFAEDFLVVEILAKTKGILKNEKGTFYF